jgi:hypothetical protein
MKRAVPLVIILISLLLGVVFGRWIFGARNSAPTVTREALLTSLKSEGFLISQSAILDQEVEIDRSTGSAFKDFFWGQTITASAKMNVSSGVDLTALSEEDVIVQGNSINIIIPDIETHSVELIGQIELKNSQGILKKVFDNDDGYNVALEELSKAAKSAVEAGELRYEARESAKREIERLIRFVAGERKVIVE